MTDHGQNDPPDGDGNNAAPAVTHGQNVKRVARAPADETLGYIPHGGLGVHIVDSSSHDVERVSHDVERVPDLASYLGDVRAAILADMPADEYARMLMRQARDGKATALMLVSQILGIAGRTPANVAYVNVQAYTQRELAAARDALPAVDGEYREGEVQTM
jgi:hypothetical protein